MTAHATVLYSLCGPELKERRLQEAAARILGVKWEHVNAAVQENEETDRVAGEEARRRFTRRRIFHKKTRKLSDETIATVVAYWLDPANTRVSPCKRDTVLVRPNPGDEPERVRVQWLEESQTDFFFSFRRDHPEIHIQGVYSNIAIFECSNIRACKAHSNA